MSSQEILGLKNVVKKINLDSVALVISEIESFFFFNEQKILLTSQKKQRLTNNYTKKELRINYIHKRARSVSLTKTTGYIFPKAPRIK